MPQPLRLVILIVLLAAAALLVQTLMPVSLEKQAMAAYNSQDFRKAVPLLEQWSQTPAVQNNPQLLAQVTEYTARAAYNAKDYDTAATWGKKWKEMANDQNSRMASEAFAVLCQQAKNGGPIVDPGEPTVIATGEDRTPHAPLAPGEIRTMRIKTLGNFDYDPNKGGNPPADVMALDGGHLRLKGFMLPLSSAAKVTDFALVPTLGSCCFGAPPGVQHVITCHLPAGTDFNPDELWVEGTLHVRPKVEDGYTVSLFELDAKAIASADVITP